MLLCVFSPMTWNHCVKQQKKGKERNFNPLINYSRRKAMQQPYPPCPVCGGTQAFFNGSKTNASIFISFSGGMFSGGVLLGALICLNCGHTELRPHPNDMVTLLTGSW